MIGLCSPASRSARSRALQGARTTLEGVDLVLAPGQVHGRARPALGGQDDAAAHPRGGARAQRRARARTGVRWCSSGDGRASPIEERLEPGDAAAGRRSRAPGGRAGPAAGRRAARLRRETAAVDAHARDAHTPRRAARSSGPRGASISLLDIAGGVTLLADGPRPLLTARSKRSRTARCRASPLSAPRRIAAA